MHIIYSIALKDQKTEMNYVQGLKSMSIDNDYELVETGR